MTDPLTNTFTGFTVSESKMKDFHFQFTAGDSRAVTDHLTGAPGQTDDTHMLSWMNLLILLLVYLSSLYFTEPSSNLLLSRGGRNRITPLQSDRTVTAVPLHPGKLILTHPATLNLLSVDAVALEESFRVGVSEAVVVPQGAGCLQKLCLCQALPVSKEPWEKTHPYIHVHYGQLEVQHIPLHSAAE